MKGYIQSLSKLGFNKDKLIENINDAKLRPYDLRNKSEWDTIYGAIWKNESIHIRHRKQTGIMNSGNEVLRLKNIISNIIGEEVKPVATLHRKDAPLPMHKDKMQCSINIVLSGNISPITFEDIGDVYYETALINVSKMHCVKPSNEPRLLLKYCIEKTPYEICEEKLNAFI